MKKIKLYEEFLAEKNLQNVELNYNLLLEELLTNN